MLTETRREARLQLVEEHVRCENSHDLEGVLKTFGHTAFYDDEPWRDKRHGIGGVRSYYEELLRAIPDLQIDVQRSYATDDNVILEVTIRGTHLGPWRGLPATGRRVEVPLCGIYDFDADDRLAGETIYYDRATVLQQLGVLHDPRSMLGQTLTALTHPITVARVGVRAVFARRR